MYAPESLIFKVWVDILKQSVANEDKDFLSSSPSVALWKKYDKIKLNYLAFCIRAHPLMTSINVHPKGWMMAQ